MANIVVDTGVRTPISSAIRQGFLVEAAATNLVLYSEQFDNATGWTSVASGAAAPVVTANQAVAPDGNTTADEITFGAITLATDYTIRQTQNMTVSATTYSNGIYLKAKAAGDIGKVIHVYMFNFGTIKHINTVTLTASWQRAINSGALVADTGSTLAFGVLGSNAGGIASQAAVSCYVWGAMMAAEPATSSYIPTTTTGVPRNADVATIATGSWYNALAGTLYTEWFAPTVVPAASIAASFNDATANNQITNYASSTIQGRFYCAVATVAQADIFANTITPGAVCKLSSVFTANDFAGWVNNSAMNTDATGTLPTVTRLELGAVAGTLYLNSTIRAIRYYPVRLNNVTAQNLTV